MQTILNTPDDPAHDSLVEKKSEFIGDAAHVDTLDEALAFVAAIREQHGFDFGIDAESEIPSGGVQPRRASARAAAGRGRSRRPG